MLRRKKATQCFLQSESVCFENFNQLIPVLLVNFRFPLRWKMRSTSFIGYWRSTLMVYLSPCCYWRRKSELSVFTSVCLSFCLSVRLSIHQSVCLSVCPFVCPFVPQFELSSACPSFCLSVCLPARSSVSLFVCPAFVPQFELSFFPYISLSIRLFVCPSICTSVCPSICLSVSALDVPLKCRMMYPSV